MDLRYGFKHRKDIPIGCTIALGRLRRKVVVFGIGALSLTSLALWQFSGRPERWEADKTFLQGSAKSGWSLRSCGLLLQQTKANN